MTLCQEWIFLINNATSLQEYGERAYDVENRLAHGIQIDLYCTISSDVHQSPHGGVFFGSFSAAECILDNPQEVVLEILPEVWSSGRDQFVKAPQDSFGKGSRVLLCEKVLVRW